VKYLLNETFYLDGVSAKSVGINLQGIMTFSEAVPIVETEHIDGRNGDLVFDTGAFDNSEATANCFALNEGVLRDVSATNNFLFSKKGYRRLESDSDPRHFWMARIKNGTSIQPRMMLLNPFEIKFDCKPQRFLKDGEDVIEFTSPSSIYNQYGFGSLPIIKVYLENDGNLVVGKYNIEIENTPEGFIILDSDIQSAYNNNGNQNSKIKCDEFPVLEFGENNIYFDGGITKIEITPRWWEI
jgi:phage-related protein